MSKKHTIKLFKEFLEIHKRDIVKSSEGSVYVQGYYAGKVSALEFVIEVLEGKRDI